MTNVKIEKFGQEQEPIAVIDDLSDVFDALRRQAQSLSYQRLGPHYPGIRAPADVEYLKAALPILRPILEDVFGAHAGLSLVESAYSIVTTRPNDLTPIQCMPHFDGVEPERLAVLHYLSDETTGGTAFYRHRATGYETVTADKYETYRKTLEAEVAQDGLPRKDYMRGDTKRFECIGRISARPNRCLIYRGTTLHSGWIPKDLPFDPNPASGRLTINTFLRAKPVQDLT